MASKPGGSKGGSGGGGAAAKGKKPSKSGAAEQKTEDVLQAVVRVSPAGNGFVCPDEQQLLTGLLCQIIADTFQDRFKPFTVDTPRVSTNAPTTFSVPFCTWQDTS
jgi:hypothetical protein